MRSRIGRGFLQVEMDKLQEEVKDLEKQALDGISSSLFSGCIEEGIGTLDCQSAKP